MGRLEQTDDILKLLMAKIWVQRSCQKEIHDRLVYEDRPASRRNDVYR